MADVREGGCRCGQLRYRFAQTGPLLNYCCHCHDCQKSTGSAFADQVIIEAEGFAIQGEEALFTIERPDNAGNSTHHICANCHARVYVDNTARPGIVILRAGTLDAPEDLDPFVHIWVRRKRNWITLDAHIPTFDESPDPAAFFALIQAHQQA